MSDQDDQAGQANKAKIVLSLILITDHQTAGVIEPSNKPFDFTSTCKSSQGSTILGLGISAAIDFVLCDHLGSKLLQNLTIQLIAIIGFVTDQLLRRLGHKTLLQRGSHQLHFSRASTFCAYGDRKTMAVCNGHDLGALASFCLSNATPPFFAGTNVPSIKHSFKSNPPRSFKSWATAKSTCSSTSDSTQSWNRRCTV